MQVMTLNIWGGHVKLPLLSFLSKRQHISVFCFQEVYHQAKAMITDEDRKVELDIFDQISQVLPNHTGYFKPIVNGIYGIAMFIHNNIEVLEEGDELIYHNPNYLGLGPGHDRILQWATCRNGSQDFTIINIHGLWNGLGKLDSEDRLLQSLKIKTFMNQLNTPVILCGDFNLRPDTESLGIVKEGMNDWVQINNITSTRTKYYPKAERFADYVFTSKSIKVKGFHASEEAVSDHAALCLDF